MASELKVNTITEATAGSGITFAKDIIPATPLSHRNMVINGAMQVWQRATDITSSDGTNEDYTSVDRWALNINAASPGSLDIDRSTDTPAGFGYSQKLKCAATGTPSGATQMWQWRYKIEAQDLQHLNYGSSDAEVMTLSWYMKSVNYTSPISFYIHKPDGTGAQYNRSVSPTTSWARYSITIPANTNSGHTIANDNGNGMTIGIILSATSGGTYQQTGQSSAWTDSSGGWDYYINDQGNFFSSTSNELYLTGFQLELGSVATPFEHRSYGEELARCERYCQKIGLITPSKAREVDRARACDVHFKTAMRANCTVPSISNTDGVSLTISGQSPDGFHCYYTATSDGMASGVNAGTIVTAEL